MTEEYDFEGAKKFFEYIANDCPWVKFHIVDLDNADEQMKEEMIHAFIVIPQWCERPKRERPNHRGEL